MKTILLSLLFVATIAAAPGSPAHTPSTVVDVFKGSSTGMLLGAWDGKKWVSDEAWHSRVRGGERYRFYGATGPLGEAAGAKPRLSEASGSAWQVDVKGAPSNKADCIGLTGRWNALPRTAADVDASSAVFRSAVSGVLRQKGLAQAPIRVTRVLRVDLDGDGTEEALICATNPRLLESSGEALMKAEAADYSFVLLRHQVGGKFVSTILAGEFKPGKNDTVNVFELGAPVDLNGDGRMEIVIRWRYYEGGGTQVFELKNGRARKVLAASDGA